MTVPRGLEALQDRWKPLVPYPALVDQRGVERWMEAYRAAWISNVPSEVAALFTEDALYSVSPFSEPWIGRDEIVRRWVAGIHKTSS